MRGPVWVALWSLDLGIYAIFWFYYAVKDLSEYGKAKGYDLGQNPTNTLLAVLFGWILLFIPTIIAIYRFVEARPAGPAPRRHAPSSSTAGSC